MNKYRSNEEELALALMTMWALNTGRTMPGMPLVCLSEEELIDFWAE